MNRARPAHALAFEALAADVELADIEEIGTLYLLHYKLATNKENATSWYYFFNRLNLSEFTEEDFSSGLEKFLRNEGYENDILKRSVSDDFFLHHKHLHFKKQVLKI